MQSPLHLISNSPAGLRIREHHKSKHLAGFLALLLIPLFVGCAGIRSENMVPPGASFGAHHNRSVALKVSGGSPGVQWFSVTITPGQFEEAIRLSIENSKLFRQITDQAGADCLMSVNLAYAGSHPGFTMNAWVNATWTLNERATGRAIWTKDVSTQGSATMGDAVMGAHRQCMALERAAKANIESALSSLGQSKLP